MYLETSTSARVREAVTKWEEKKKKGRSVSQVENRKIGLRLTTFTCDTSQ